MTKLKYRSLCYVFVLTSCSQSNSPCRVKANPLENEMSHLRGWACGIVSWRNTTSWQNSSDCCVDIGCQIQPAETRFSRYYYVPKQMSLNCCKSKSPDCHQQVGSTLNLINYYAKLNAC